MPGLTALSALPTKPAAGRSAWPRSMRSGATAAVGSARTQPRRGFQYSAQACALLWRTMQ